MQIYLLRHGIAENASPGQPDSERALTAEGREKLRRVLKRARSAEVNPGAILSSPYKRALETAEVAAEALGFKGEIERTPALVPASSPYDAWEALRARRSSGSVLLASHEPLMSSLAAFLLGCPALQVDMKKAALVRIDCDRFPSQPRGVLKWMLTPATADE
jgi:phosphohistidine phosphatase